MRRSHVAALDVIAYTDGIAMLDLGVSSGTYVRSIADALGGHCVTLRRTEVGPFSVDEADPERVLRLEDALGRIGLTVAEAEAEQRRKSLSDREAALAGRAGEEHGPASGRRDRRRPGSDAGSIDQTGRGGPTSGAGPAGR
jgi:tRNA U55 pseudouridine synthase TruB